MATFTPPTILEVPPIPVADTKHSPPYATQNPLGAALFKYFGTRQRGVCIFKMSDGTYRSARPVPGLTEGLGGTVPVLEPWPPIPEFPVGGAGGVPNDAIAWTWSYLGGQETPLTQPTVSLVYYGGEQHPVSAAEVASLTAHGFGAYLS